MKAPAEGIPFALPKKRIKYILILSLGILLFTFGIWVRLANFQMEENVFDTISILSKNNNYRMNVSNESNSNFILSSLVSCQASEVTEECIYSNPSSPIPPLSFHSTNNSFSISGCMHDMYIPKSHVFYSQLHASNVQMDGLNCSDFLNLVFGNAYPDRVVHPLQSFLNFTASHMYYGLKTLRVITSHLPLAMDNRTFEIVLSQNNTDEEKLKENENKRATEKDSENAIVNSKEIQVKVKEKEKENEKKEEGEGEGENLLFFGIFSAPDHWNQRMGVRESWLKFDALKQGLANYKFFVGWSTNMTINLRLVEENLRYKDLIILPFIDHYFILTLKTLSLCLYAHYYLPRKSKFVMKADDDTFVRVDAIIAKLRPHVHDDSLYYGALVYNGQVDRNPKSKWFVSFQEWYPHTYPTWAHGPGYVISYSFAQRIVSEFNKGKLDYFKLEDISMSVWVSNLKNENTSFLDDGTLNFDGCRDNYTIAHYQNPQRMQCLWRKLSSDADASCCEHV